MHRTERFSYTIGETADSGGPSGLLRYGVVVTELDEQGRSGDTAAFYVVFQDRGDRARNEAQAIGQARNFAFAVANDSPSTA